MKAMGRQPAPWTALVLAAMGTLLGLGAPDQVRAQANPAPVLLYNLETNCSLAGGAQSRCSVEAFDGKGATVYRTTVNGERISFRLLDQSHRQGAELWDNQKKGWVSLNRISLDFAANAICIDKDRLCIENPNYFQSLREDYPNLKSDLIIATFNPENGTLAAICYSRAACDAGF